VILRSSLVVLPDGVRAASIHIENGRIARISDGQTGAYDFGNRVISPGIVDTHVHINEPGRTEWEGFDTGTRAAAAGGVTTIVDMPLNSIPATTTVAALVAKRAAARGHVHVDVGFWGGVVPGNAHELDALVDAGVRGFKCFLTPSGVDEFQHVGEADLRVAMPILARRGVPLLVHAENPALIADCGFVTAAYAPYLASRPPVAEATAVEMMVRLAREFGTHVHVVHVACAEAVDVIAGAKADGVAITAETCPHYLTFAAEDIPDGATEFKCAPPIRGSTHRAALWTALRSGALDLIATDHSPAPPAMKPRGDFARAWGGIASLECSLAAMCSGNPATASELGRWMSAAPARLAGLESRKGRIAPGWDADLVIWDPVRSVTVDPQRMQQRHKLTPYAGRSLRGAVTATFLRGERIWDDGALVAAERGQLL
jgi:allantoinase